MKEKFPEHITPSKRYLLFFKSFASVMLACGYWVTNKCIFHCKSRSKNFKDTNLICRPHFMHATWVSVPLNSKMRRPLSLLVNTLILNGKVTQYPRELPWGGHSEAVLYALFFRCLCIMSLPRREISSRWMPLSFLKSSSALAGVAQLVTASSRYAKVA